MVADERGGGVGRDFFDVVIGEAVVRDGVDEAADFVGRVFGECGEGGVE